MRCSLRGRLFRTRNPDAWAAIHTCWSGEDVHAMTTLPFYLALLSLTARLPGLLLLTLARSLTQLDRKPSPGVPSVGRAVPGWWSFTEVKRRVGSLCSQVCYIRSHFNVVCSKLPVKLQQSLACVQSGETAINRWARGSSPWVFSC